MLDTETKRRIDSCRDILVGKIPDPKSQVEQITIALIYKFMDDMDQWSIEQGGKSSFFSGEFQKYSWTSIFNPRISGYEILNLYGEAVMKMDQNPNIPQLFRDIFKNAYLPYRDPETLRMFLKEISGFHYDHSEKLGDAFEYLLSVLSSQGDAGQFRTPRHIIDFIVNVVEPKVNDTVLDPACGTAGFLISAYKHILKNNSNITNTQKKRLMNNFVGYDISYDMVRLSLVNMYLHRFPEPHIYEYDTLTSEDRWNDSFDIIMANPPFMSPKGGIRPHSRFSIPAKRSEVLFVDYIAEHLNPSGRAGVIVPEGIIFQSQNAYKALRKMLVDNYLWAVVSLPAGIFNPYSGVKTSILFMDKSLAKRIDRILFVKIENDGFDLGAQRRTIDKNDLPAALKFLNIYKSKVENYKSQIEDVDFVHAVTKKEIAKTGDYNLTGDRYRKFEKHHDTKWPMVELGEIVEVLDKLRKPITKCDRTKGKYPYYGATGIVDYVNDFIFDERLVLIGEDGAKWGAGEKTAFIAEGKYWVNNHAHVLRCNPDKIADTFLVELLNLSDLTRYITGVTVPKLNQEKLRSIKIPLPPLEVQEKIVTEIDGYQKIIDGARQIVENYKPTIKINPTWPVVSLEKVFKLSSGKGLTQKERVEGPYKVYGGNGVTGNHNEYFLENPTLIIGRVGEYCGAVHITEPKSWVTDNALYVTAYLIEVNQNYLAFVLQKTDINQYAKVGGQPSISQSTVASIQVSLPPVDEQKQIVAEIEAEQKIVNENKKLIEIFENKINNTISGMWCFK
jgi:type I restriction enzyme M protein